MRPSCCGKAEGCLLFVEKNKFDLLTSYIVIRGLYTSAFCMCAGAPPSAASSNPWLCVWPDSRWYKHAARLAPQDTVALPHSRCVYTSVAVGETLIMCQWLWVCVSFVCVCARRGFSELARLNPLHLSQRVGCRAEGGRRGTKQMPSTKPPAEPTELYNVGLVHAQPSPFLRHARACTLRSQLSSHSYFDAVACAFFSREQKERRREDS